MSNDIIFVNTDSRFSNPFGGDSQKFYEWAVEQTELIQLIHYLADSGFKFKSKDGHYYGRHVEAIHQLIESPRTPEPIYVFGSNEGGIHGAGSARLAKLHYDAVVGQASGIQGKSYGIPTKSKSLEVLTLEQIYPYVEEFIDFAACHPALQFDVQRIGTGLSGYSQTTMAELFKRAIDKLPKPLNNVSLPYSWVTDTPKRWIIAGSRSTDRLVALKCCSEVSQLIDDPKAIFISGGAWGVDKAGEIFAIENGFEFKRYPAWWEKFGKKAGYIRNYKMDREATNLLAIWDGASRGTYGMIESAQSSGLGVIIKKTN